MPHYLYNLQIKVCLSSFIPRSEFLFTLQSSIFIPLFWEFYQQYNVIRQIQRNSLRGKNRQKTAAQFQKKIFSCKKFALIFNYISQHNIITMPKLPKPALKLIINEDCTFGGNQLFIDLIPRSCWFTSIRTAVVKSDWDRIRHFVYQRAGHQCQCCKSPEKLQAHERWNYDQDLKQQKLMRIVCLCQKCHLVTHFGRAQCIGYDEQAKEHLMKVRNWNQGEFQTHKKQAFQLWRLRNQTSWKLDLSLIKQNDFRLAKKYEELRKKNDA